MPLQLQRISLKLFSWLIEKDPNNFLNKLSFTFTQNLSIFNTKHPANLNLKSHAKMKATFFKNQLAFRKWLERNHLKERELLVGYYKVNSGKPSMNWSESVDQALCFGWIDGIRRSIDDESYCIRFTPRKPNSIWSAINIKKVEVLTKAGLMKPEGLKIFELRKDEHSKIYSHENEEAALSPNYEKQFKKNKSAWHFFTGQAASYRRLKIYWVMNAKQEKTRQARLNKLIEVSGNQKRLL